MRDDRSITATLCAIPLVIAALVVGLIVMTLRNATPAPAPPLIPHHADHDEPPWHPVKQPYTIKPAPDEPRENIQAPGLGIHHSGDREPVREPAPSVAKQPGPGPVFSGRRSDD